jgi:hypothetical protein
VRKGLEIGTVVLPRDPDEVVVPGVAERPQQPPDPRAVPEADARYEVRQPRWRPTAHVPPRRRGGGRRARRAERRVEDGEREERQRQEQRVHPPAAVRQRGLVPHESPWRGVRAREAPAFARRPVAYGQPGQGGWPLLASWWRQTDERAEPDEASLVQGNRVEPVEKIQCDLVVRSGRATSPGWRARGDPRDVEVARFIIGSAASMPGSDRLPAL